MWPFKTPIKSYSVIARPRLGQTLLLQSVQIQSRWSIRTLQWHQRKCGIILTGWPESCYEVSYILVSIVSNNTYAAELRGLPSHFELWDFTLRYMDNTAITVVRRYFVIWSWCKWATKESHATFGYKHGFQNWIYLRFQYQ